MKKLVALSALGMAALGANAQLTITDSLTIGSITTLLEGIGVTVSNVTVNCAEHAMGHFIGTSELSITEGLLLTSGAADMVAGPSGNFATWYSSTGGDADIEAALAMGNITYDVCALEFDCMPQGDTLLFNFSFGSEEYQEFVGSSFNDAFAIYLSGPGFPVATNVAAIPGGTIVSINNVNALLNGGYFYDNEFPAGQYVAYDGFTTNLTVFAVVQPGQPYHFKVVVTDVGDQAFDSGVFLEAFSFRSPMLTTGIRPAAQPALQASMVDGSLLLDLGRDGAAPMPLTIVDAAGHVVFNGTTTGRRTVLGLSTVVAGLYAVRLDGTGEVLTARFVKD
ncbi:MAG: choice-of-anchor L domain-containing protein [Flavobacteriales bacterium]